MNLAAGAPPAFFGPPLLNRDAIASGGVIVSSGDAFKHRALDMSPRTAATSQGQADDTSTWTYQAKQYDGTAVNGQPVDCLALLRINFKRFTVQYRSGGGSWTMFPGADYSAVDFAADHLILPINSPVTADEWLLTVLSTQTPNQEKSLGNLIVCQQSFQASIGSSGALDDKLDENIVTVELMDKSKDQTLLLHNDLDFEFKTMPLVFVCIPAAEEAQHSALRGGFFLVAPQPGDFPLLWRHVRIVPNSYQAQPFSMTLGETRKRVAYSVQEVGTP